MANQSGRLREAHLRSVRGARPQDRADRGHSIAAGAEPTDWPGARTAGTAAGCVTSRSPDPPTQDEADHGEDQEHDQEDLRLFSPWADPKHPGGAPPGVFTS